MNTQSRYNYPSQLALLLLITGVSFFIGTIITMGLSVAIFKIPILQMEESLKSFDNPNLFRFMQASISIMGMGLPAFIFAKVVSNKPLERLGFSSQASFRQLFFVCMIMTTCLIAGNFFTRINELIPLTGKMEIYFKGLEQDYAKQILSLANMQSLKDFIITVFVIALLPAMVEELLFRGCFQRLFIEWTKKPFVGILIASIIFSAIHVSFYGFLPRLFLGIVMGYIFYYGKNIHLNIIAHFINNLIAVTSLYVASRAGTLTTEMVSKEDHFEYYYSIPALVVVGIMLFFFKKDSEKELGNEVISE